MHRKLTLAVVALATLSGSALVAEPTKLTISGNVRDPSGNLVPRASVKLLGPDYALVDQSITSRDGTFTMSANKTDFQYQAKQKATVAAWRRAILVANHDDFGPDWLRIDQLDSTREVTLNVVEDIPIRGQIIDAEGRPVVGARVSVGRINAAMKENLEEFFKKNRDRPSRLWLFRRDHMRQVPGGTEVLTPNSPISTDEEGRFQYRGIGRDRIATLLVQGRNIASSSFIVATVPTIDAKWNRKDNSRVVQQLKMRGGEVPTVYPATFHHVALPGRSVSGFVRSKATGEPIAGADVYGRVGGVGLGGNESHAKTDEDGRYELFGLKTEGELSLRTYTPPQLGLLGARRGPIAFTAAADIADTSFDLVRGIVIRGKVIDAASNQPVKANVSYSTIIGNKYVRGLGDSIPAGSEATNTNGEFRIVAAPGPGLVTVSAYEGSYQFISPEEFEFPVDEQGFVATNEQGLIHPEFNRICAVYPLLESESRKEIELTFKLTSLSSKRIQLVDRNEGQLYGVNPFVGVDETFAPIYGKPLESAELSVSVQPNQSQLHLFHHRKQQLGGYALLTSKSPNITKVSMRPLGSIRGRLTNRPQSDEPDSNIVMAINQTGDLPKVLSMVKLDADGHFRLPNIVSGLTVQVIAGYPSDGLLLGETRLRSGENIQLRDIDAAKAEKFHAKKD